MPNKGEYSPLGQRIAVAAGIIGVTVPELLRRIGASKNMASRWLKGVNAPRRETLAAIAALSGVDLDWLQTGRMTDLPFSNLAGPALRKPWGDAEGDADLSIGPAMAAPGNEVRPLPVPVPAVPAGAPVPVLGTAAGALAGAIAISGEAVGYLGRPPALAKVSDAYALYVVNGSMADRYRPGDPVFVDPHRQVHPGDVVIIQVQDFDGGDVLSYIKEFVGRDDGFLTAVQYNPRAVIRFSNRTVKSVHRVLQLRELFGL